MLYVCLLVAIAERVGYGVQDTGGRMRRVRGWDLKVLRYGTSISGASREQPRATRLTSNRPPLPAAEP